MIYYHQWFLSTSTDFLLQNNDISTQKSPSSPQKTNYTTKTMTFCHSLIAVYIKKVLLPQNINLF